MRTLEGLHAALTARLGAAEPSPAALAALGDDPLARAARDAATAGEGVPVLLGTVRRGRLVAWDAASATWDAWDTATGQRLWVRVARRGHEDRLLAAKGQPGVLPMEVRAEGVPHLRSAPLDGTLADLLPLADPPEPAWVARVLGGLLDGLAQLHAAGRVQGDVVPELMVQQDGRWWLAWLDPIDGGDPRGEVRAAGELAGQLDPAGDLGLWAEDLAVSPPPSAADAVRLLREALAASLAEGHHRVVARARKLERAARRGRLREAMRRLVAAVPPPTCRGCLRVEADGRTFVVMSDGVVVRAGAWGGGALERLPVLWARRNLEPLHARAALRAWAGRAGGDPTRRHVLNAELGGDDAALERLCRWITGMARLRADAMVLDAPRR